MRYLSKEFMAWNGYGGLGVLEKKLRNLQKTCKKSPNLTTYFKFLATNWAKLHTLMVSVPSPSANDAIQAKKGALF